jgi:hypothetical protein
MQPVKIIDPHLVSSFFDDFKRSYLHTTVQLQNKSSWVAECNITLQVTTDLEGNICLVEHFQNSVLTIPAKSDIEYTLPPVSGLILSIPFLHIKYNIPRKIKIGASIMVLVLAGVVLSLCKIIEREIG